MHSNRCRGLALACVASMALTACCAQNNHAQSSQSGASGTRDASPAHAGAQKQPVNTQPSPSAGIHIDKKHYKIDIDFPNLGNDAQPLQQAIHQQADTARLGFLASLPDFDNTPGFENRQLFLLINFKTASKTARFISVHGNGGQAMGGAHPLPVEMTWVYDRKSHQVITLSDLFAKPDAALQALSGYARQILNARAQASQPDSPETTPQARRQRLANLGQMITAGTQPTTANFSAFVIIAGEHDKARGIQLIFSPYQVGPYAAGTQTVNVPASLFVQFLKPQYRRAFVDQPAS